MPTFLGELRALVNELGVTEVLHYDELFSATQLACSLAELVGGGFGNNPPFQAGLCA